MSHYHLEIIMPPTDDIAGAVAAILAPFDENLEKSSHAFWDYYLIGGRWSGTKMMHLIGADKIAAFREHLNAQKITISSVQFGKPTLMPTNQKARVDQMWREAFPASPVKECPLFDYYSGTAGDVMMLAETPRDTPCAHIIIAGPGYERSVEALSMLQTDVWNGVELQPTAWDGTIGAALNFWTKHLENYREEWRPTRTPADDWLVVTVDYHS